MSRNFVFTSFEKDEPKFDKSELQHLAYKREQCPESKKEHWQGCGQFIKKNRKAFKTIAKILGSVRIHVERMHGTYEQAFAYVAKKETAIGDVIQHGEFTTQGERTDIKEACHVARLRDISEETYVRYGRGIKDYRNLHAKKRTEMPIVTIYYGPTDSGKSSKLPIDDDTYWKPPGDHKWWDGYDAHPKVVLDEFYPGSIYFTREIMLRICDRYPLMVETKGSFINFVAKEIFITSNSDPNNWFMLDGDNSAWLRRVKIIKVEKEKQK